MAQKVSYQRTCFKNFGPAILKYSNHEIEFIGARKEYDQKRRDLTSLNPFNYGKLIDQLYGLSESRTYSSDTLRMLLALRFSSLQKK